MDLSALEKGPKTLRAQQAGSVTKSRLVCTLTRILCRLDKEKVKVKTSMTKLEIAEKLHTLGFE